MPDGPLRVAIAGYGLAGGAFHAPLVAVTPGLAVAAVLSRDADRAAQARAAHPEAAVLDDIGALLATRPDVLVVATANRAHAEVALAAIEAGVPLVVDKPLATGVAEAERVLAAAEAAEVPLTVFQNRRWDGDLLTVRRLLADGVLGDVVRFESRFERFRPHVKTGWREDPGVHEGGGTLLDLGSHLIDQASLLFGFPVAVYAEIGTRRSGAKVDDDAFVSLEHPRGVHSHLWMGAVAPLAGPRLSVTGLAGGFTCDGMDPQEDKLRAGVPPTVAAFGERPPGRLVDAGGERDVPMEPGCWQAFYAGVRAWLADGAAPPVDPKDAVAVLRVVEAARRSAATRTVSKLVTG